MPENRHCPSLSLYASDGGVFAQKDGGVVRSWMGAELAP